MTKAEEVKNKLLGMIDKVNELTGEHDTNLASAVDTLVATGAPEANRAEAAAVRSETAATEAEAAAQAATAKADEVIAQRVAELGVVQSTGSSPTAVMSQKATTDELNNINEIVGLPVTVAGGTGAAVSPAYEKVVIASGFSLKAGNIYIFEATATTSASDYIAYVAINEENGSAVRTIICQDENSGVASSTIAATRDFQNLQLVMQTNQASGLSITAHIKKTGGETIDLLFRKHEADLNKHLRKKIISNNLFDLTEVERGGYYLWSTGAWIVRSDISSTGFIPCQSGETYVSYGNNLYFGGNITFYDENYKYLQGIDATTTPFVVPDNANIKYFKISFPTSLIPNQYQYRVNADNLKDYDEYKSVFEFDREIITPTFNSSSATAECGNKKYYSQTYKDDVAVFYNRNKEVGTTYQITIINNVKFNGTKTKVSIAGTSKTNALGDANNTNVVTFARANELIHVINGGIYLVTTGEADGITIIDGNILKSTGVEQFPNEQYVLGIDANGNFKAYINKTANEILSDGSIYALTGFVPLIVDGEAVSDSTLAICPHGTARHPRQIVGKLMNGEYFTFVCDGRTDGENGMTLRECIKTIKDDLNVSFAFNLDGGGSAQSVVGKKQINRMIDGRTVPNVIVFE